MISNKAKFYFLVIGFVVLAFSIIMAFLLHENNPIEFERGQFLYYTTKVIVSLSLVLVILYIAFFKKDRANIIIQMVLTLILQFLPLIVRFMLTREEPRFILTVVLVFVVFIIYLIFVLSFDLLTDRVKKVQPKLEGKKINVVDETSYYDENGNFIGAKKKENVKNE